MRHLILIAFFGGTVLSGPAALSGEASNLHGDTIRLVRPVWLPDTEYESASSPRPDINSATTPIGHSFRLASFHDVFSCAASGVCGVPSVCGEAMRPCERQDAQTYVAFTHGFSWLSGDSFGFNSLGGFNNWQHDVDADYLLGGAIGRRTPFEIRGRKLAVRTEVQGTDYHDYSLVTDGFPGAPGPTAFHYRVDVGDVWSVSTNLWLDIPVHEDVELYVGGGMGVAQHQVALQDTVVHGFARDTDMMSMFGTGVNFYLSERVVLDIGYRLTDLGTSKVPLQMTGTGTPSGNYKLDIETDEVTATLRILLW